MFRHLMTGIAASALAFGLAGAAMAKGEKVSIAELSWDGARAIGYVMKEVIETRLDTDVEMKKAEAAVIFASMDKGDGGLDVYPDVWMPNQKEKWAEYVDKRKTVLHNKTAYKGEQALFIPKYVQDEHGVKTIDDLKKPEVAKLFDTDGDGLGEYWAGAPGWASTNEWEIKFKSYGLSDLWEPLIVDDAVFKGQMDAAYTKKQPVMFYYWTPEWLHAAYDLVKIQ
jgi:glycine betaine/proline transport system substrate-binding protein